jgi:hypothetical protein
VCVDTSPLEKLESSSSNSDSYADRMRSAADSAPERVVAVVYFLPGEFAFDGGAVRVPVAKVRIVACKVAYRQRSSEENIIKALFEMVNGRAHAAGCVFMVTAGIPGYCTSFHPFLCAVANRAHRPYPRI